MKKVVVVILFVGFIVGSLVSCGSSKHAGRCDAYSLNKAPLSTQDLVVK